MKNSAWIVLIYALIVFLGGMIGFNQAHSMPSLIAGTVSATLLLICALGMFKRSVLAYTLAMAIILALMLFFGYRFTATGKFMPSGMMMILSASSLLYILMRRKKKAKLG